MSNRQLEDRDERRRIEAIAEATGMTTDEAEQWVENDYPEESSDGLTYGHVIELSDDAPADLIARLGGTSVNIGPLNLDDDFDEDPDEDQVS